MKDLTLIQLISEQTIQNLLPMLRLKPRKVVHLVTPKTAQRSAPVISAAKAAGLRPELETIQLSDMPAIPECCHVVDDVLEREGENGRQAVVNFTGGTKLMSIGAYTAARNRNAPSLYVDTQGNRFDDGDTSPEMAILLENDWSFTPVRQHLRVDVIGIANGVPRITGGLPWKPMFELAEHLFHHPEEEARVHEAIHGPKGLIPRGREPFRTADWLSLIDTSFDLPVDVARMACERDLLRAGSRPTEVFLPDQTKAELLHLSENRVSNFPARLFQAVAPIQGAAAFLTGGWWEVIVCDAAHQSGEFRDLRWSVQVGERNGPDTEEDVLAVDGVQLLYISCKRGGHRSRLLPLLEEIRARAATIGGVFNRRILAIRNPPQGRTAANLIKQADRLGIRIISGEDVYNPSVFSR